MPRALRDDDAGVAGRTQTLQLGDGGRTFVESAAVGRRDVAPAALFRLGFAAEFHGLLQQRFELLAAFVVFFFPVHAGQEHQPETVPVDVAGRFGRVLRIAEEAVVLRTAEEPRDGFDEVIAVFPFAEGAAFHEHGHPGEGGHHGRVGTAAGVPVTVRVLVPLEPFQPLVHHLVGVDFLFILRERRAGRRYEQNGDRESGKDGEP